MRRTAAVAVMMVVGSLVAPASAVAWDTYPCESGELKVAETVYGPPGPHLTVPGVLDCAVKVAGPKFVVALFVENLAEGFYTRDLMYDYASPTGPTTFKLIGDFGSDQPFDVGLCLMTDEQTRLSCIHFTKGENYRVKSLSTSDRLVTKPIKISIDGGTTPNCGGCWRVTK